MFIKAKTKFILLFIILLTCLWLILCLTQTNKSCALIKIIITFLSNVVKEFSKILVFLLHIDFKKTFNQSKTNSLINKPINQSVNKLINQ